MHHSLCSSPPNVASHWFMSIFISIQLIWLMHKKQHLHFYIYMTYLLVPSSEYCDKAGQHLKPSTPDPLSSSVRTQQYHSVSAADPARLSQSQTKLGFKLTWRGRLNLKWALNRINRFCIFHWRRSETKSCSQRKSGGEERLPCAAALKCVSAGKRLLQVDTLPRAPGGGHTHGEGTYLSIHPAPKYGTKQACSASSYTPEGLQK